MIRPSSKFATLVIVAATLLIYSGALSNGFVLDDHGVVLANPWIKDLRNLPGVFLSSVWAFDGGHSGSSNYYRPTIHLFFMIEYSLFGLAPWGWHLVNIIFHAISALLVFHISCLLFTLTGTKSDTATGNKGFTPGAFKSKAGNGSPVPFALLCALIFALHPIAIEPVSWVSAITELSFALFVLMSLYLYISYAFNARNGDSITAMLRSPLYIGSLLAYLMAAFSKETGIVAPLLIVSFDIAARARMGPVRLKRYIPYAGATMIYFAFRLYSMSGGGLKGLLTDNPLLKLANIPLLTIEYLKLLIAPVKFSYFHLFEPATSFSEPRLIISIVILILLAILLTKIIRSREELLLPAAMLFIPILPAFILVFADTDNRLLPYLSERYLYLPLAGFAILVSSGFAWINSMGRVKKSGVVIAAILTLLGLYSALTILRIPTWKDDLSIWSNVIERDQENHIALFALAGIDMKKKEYVRAVTKLTKALRIRPDVAGLHHRLGLAYYKEGRLAMALEEFNTVIKIDPKNSDAYQNIGIIMMDTGRWMEAVSSLDKALEHANAKQRRLRLLNTLATALTGAGQPVDGLKRLKEALKIDPNDSETLTNIGYFEAPENKR